MNSPREKRGTANWVRCPRCGQWFAVGHDLLERSGSTGLRLHCPHCHHEFASAEAAQIVKGG